MTSVNISIRKEAYQFLRSLRARDQSFSDVILGRKRRQNGVMRFFGALKEKDWNVREARMNELRKEFEERL